MIMYLMTSYLFDLPEDSMLIMIIEKVQLGSVESPWTVRESAPRGGKLFISHCHSSMVAQLDSVQFFICVN